MTQARTFGVLSSLVALALAGLAAVALTDIAHHHVSRGVLLLMAVLAARWVS